MSKCKTHIAGLKVESYDYTTKWKLKGSKLKFEIYEEDSSASGGVAYLGDTRFTYEYERISYAGMHQVVLRDLNNQVLHTFEDTQHAWAEIAHKMIG